MNRKNRLAVFVMAVIILACSKDDNGDTTQPDPVNRAPVANAGDDQKVVIGTTAKLNASSSSDPDGDNLTYSWSFIRKPEESNAALVGAGQSDAEFTLDKAGVYEVQLEVSDGEDKATDTILISNTTPVINEVEARYFSIDYLTRPGLSIKIKGDFFSPSLQENSLTVGGVAYKITELMVDDEGGTQDEIKLEVAEEAISGELKLTVGEEEVAWNEPIRMASVPVRDFTDDNTHLERLIRSDGNVPDTYFEIGTLFRPKVKGQVLALRLKMPVNGSYQVNLWDTDTKTQLTSATIETTNTGSSRTVDLPNPISLEKDKQYVITVNANDWYLHIDEQDAQGNQFPKTYANIEIISTAFHEGQTSAYPDEDFPVNYIVRGPDILFAADPE
ncbi:MAG: PKD domain-containing protein [Flavobacteriaceae bacterium]